MSTINIVLMCILCTMIGYAIGNTVGKESMKRIFSHLLEELTKNLNMAAGNKQNLKGE